MKTQWVGICVSLTVHGMAAFLLFNYGQGFSPGTKTRVIDLSFAAAGSMGKAGLHTFAHELPPPGMADSGKEATPSLPGEKVPDSADTEPQPVSSAPPPLQPGKAQPVKNDFPPESQPLKKVRAEPEPPSPSMATKPLEQQRKEKDPLPPAEQMAQPPRGPKKQPTSPEPVSAKTLDKKENIPNTWNRSHGNRLVQSATTHEDRFPKPKSGPPGSGRGGYFDTSGKPFMGKTANNGANAYLNMHLGLIRQALRQSLCYPRTARQREWAGKVLIAFTIQPNGFADRIEIKKSCGIPLLDKSALATVRIAGPFPKPPSAVRIIIPILYQLN